MGTPFERQVKNGTSRGFMNCCCSQVVPLHSLTQDRDVRIAIATSMRECYLILYLLLAFLFSLSASSDSDLSVPGRPHFPVFCGRYRWAL